MLGYADDAIICTLALRSTVRCTGLDAVRAHWPGTDDGFVALCRLAGLPSGNHLADADDDVLSGLTLRRPALPAPDLARSGHTFACHYRISTLASSLSLMSSSQQPR